MPEREPTYCTAEDVSGFLQVPSFTEDTKPSLSQVNDMIIRAEDEIETRTNTAWREKQIKNYEYHDIKYFYKYMTGIPIYLKHRFVKDLDKEKGDKLEVFNGSTYEDWLEEKQEGRANDWWIDNEQGILYLRGRFILERPKGLRIIYRYGQELNGMVKDICIKMVAINILSSEDRSVLLPEGTSNVSYERKIEEWKKDVEEKLQSLKEFVLAEQ